MIRATCVSNRDEFRSSGGWPEIFVDLPRIGDYVENGNGLRMKVFSITHKTRMVFTEGKFGTSGQAKEPYVEIYLEKLC